MTFFKSFITKSGRPPRETTANTFSVVAAFKAATAPVLAPK
jgi:hypothetical protein